MQIHSTVIKQVCHSEIGDILYCRLSAPGDVKNMRVIYRPPHGGPKSEIKERLLSNISPLKFDATVFILLYLHVATHITLLVGSVLSTT